MSNKRFLSPLRYPGGKSKMSKFIEDIILVNDLKGATYIEPFAGGAGVALYLLINGICDRIIINDFDKGIYAFWYSVINHTDELCDLIINTTVDLEEWKKHREKVLNNYDQLSLLELGFSTFYLNRTNRSGIIKGGPIGGYSQSGKYKIDCRFNKEQLICRIQKIAKYKKKINLYNMDAEVFIKRIISRQKKKCFIFFDPPYINKGKDLYTNFYNYEDHFNLFNRIKLIEKHKWIVTYNISDDIKNIYSNIDYEEYYINYSAGNKRKAKEILFKCKNLTLPDSFKDIVINDV